VRTLELQRKKSCLSCKQLFLITAKPAMYVANVAEDGFTNNPYLDRLTRCHAPEGAPVVAMCAKIEAELSEMDDEDDGLPGRPGPRPSPA
jgi:ribosome-binding ATPase YchF (GTP1/OBG family)